MARPLEIDREGPGIIVSVRYARDVIDILDLIALEDSEKAGRKITRSEIVRDGAMEKIERRMKQT